ncbi:MAG: beta-lactamase family protein [Bryobacteraceae bacterium]|nr:beta-lactamase family protein [Solibacteraceae bacterium]MCO5349893.1 beta-lactamase family protein [Bryobacteraceae bacterium]
MMLRLVFLLLAALSLWAQITPEKAAALESAAARHMSTHLIPGLSVAVYNGDGPVWSAAWGFADLENHVPATPRTVFRLASISKPFTSVAAMLLAEQGRLNLDAPVQNYLRFPRKQWPVTTRLLLANQAGIRHYRGREIASTVHYDSVTEAIEIFAGDPLVHEPGTKYLYSTYGFNLAGAVVEKVAGMPFEQWVRERILLPAGITSMQADDIYRMIPHRARGYRRSKAGTLENSTIVDTSNKIPGGGWVASAGDLIAFARSLMEGNLLQPASLELMWKPGFLRDGQPTHYGLGWNIQNENGARVIQHSGGQPGTSTHLLLIPSRRIAIAVLANMEQAAPIELAREFARILGQKE